jgi:hypothetical protein
MLKKYQQSLFSKRIVLWVESNTVPPLGSKKKCATECGGASHHFVVGLRRGILVSARDLDRDDFFAISAANEALFFLWSLDNFFFDNSQKFALSKFNIIRDDLVIGTNQRKRQATR